MTEEELADDGSAAEDAEGGTAAGGARDGPAANRGEKALCEDPEGLQAPARVSWKREADGGATVWVRYHEGDPRPYWAVECRLRPDNPRATFPYPPGGSEGTLELIFNDGGGQELRGNLPLTPSNWFNGTIASWQTAPAEDASEASGRAEERPSPVAEAPADGEPVSDGETPAMDEAQPIEEQTPAEDAVPADGRNAPAAAPAATVEDAVPADRRNAPAAAPAATNVRPVAPPGRGAPLCPPGWQRGGTIIDNPARPLEIFRCLWLRRARTPAARPVYLGFVFLADPERLPFYNRLAELRTQSDGRAKMMEAAREFAETPEYVRRIAELGTPVVAYPGLVENLLAIEGVVALEEVLAVVDEFLFAFGVGPLPDYLASSYLEEVEERVWQTLFAVALGAFDEPRLGDRLVEVLRVDHFLRQLQRELAAPRQPLTTPVGRQTALRASVVLAEGAVPLALGCTSDEVSPAAGCTSDEGWVRALGIGDLKRVCQCLLGYQPGEVARVVNVMPRERLELSARELLQNHRASTAHHTHGTEEDADREQTSRSDLRHEIGDLIANDALCSFYNKLSQEYDPPTITLDGTWSGNDCLQERADREVSDYAQSLTRRAASRIVDAVAETRVHQRLEEHERLFARDVDNREGSERLVGIYRWIKKLYRLTLEDAGKRLIVEFEIADPAGDYLRHLRHLGGIRLEPPPPLPRKRVFGPDDITRENYLVLASLYGISDPEPPPPEQLVRVHSLQAQPPVSETELAVPAGYEVTDARITYLLGDGSDSLVGYVGDAPFAYSPAAPEPVAPALEPPAEALVPALESDDEPDDACPPCDPFSHVRGSGTPVQGLIALPDLTGETETAFSVTVLSTATSFFASVSLTCDLLATSGLFEAWQVRTYEALVAGFNRSRALFLKRLRARIIASSAGRERRIERQQLERAAITILASLRAWENGTSPPCEQTEAGYLEFFENAFDWPEITYAFHSWPPPEEPCGRDRHWRGEAVIDLEADELFKSFLHARSARVLVPVTPGAELQVLYYLLFGLLWPGAADDVPVAAADVKLVADLKASPEVTVAPTWCLEIPTSLRILQASDELPEDQCPLANEPSGARRELEAPETETRPHDEAAVEGS